MEYRRLGASGLKVPVLSFGTSTFAGQGPLFWAWGSTDAKGARRLVDICLEAGVTMFDTADVSSHDAAEDEHLFRLVDALDAIARETGKTVSSNRDSRGRPAHP
jgi:predicted aldo/keto reductase-like oxidoreductase